MGLRTPVVWWHLKDIFLVLPFLGSQSEVLARRVKSCVSKFYGFVNLRVIFNNTCRIKSFFPYKDRFSRSQRLKVVYRANCWDCDSFYVGETKRGLHDRKTEHFKALTQGCHASAFADYVIYRSQHQMGPFWYPRYWEVRLTVQN